MAAKCSSCKSWRRARKRNSRLEQLGTDLVHDSRHGDEIPAHMAWQRILDEEPAELDRYIAESQTELDRRLPRSSWATFACR